MYKKILVGLILLLFLVPGVVFFKARDNILLIYGLLEDRKYTENIGSKWLNILPKPLAVWKVQYAHSGCFGDYKGARISHVSLLTDIVFNQFSDPSVKLNRVKAKELIEHLVDRGCGINEIHPGSGFAPIHSAFLGAPDDYNYVFEIMRLGGDAGIRIQKPESSVNGKTARELVDHIIEVGSSKDIEHYQRLVQQLDDHHSN